MIHDVVEDRIKLCISTRDSRQVELWLTRRFVKTVWPLLVRTLASEPAVSATSAGVARQSVLAFQHEAATQDVDFDARYEPAKSISGGGEIGQGPLLINAARINIDDQSAITLILKSPDETSLRLSFNMQLLHTLCRLLRETIALSDWELELSVGQDQGVPIASGRLN